jgi:hypothetical protein
MQCYTQEEIATQVGVTHQTIDNWIDDFAKTLDSKVFAKYDFHDDSFEPPIYNVWKQQTKSAGVNHFGNSEARWLENLLYQR